MMFAVFSVAIPATRRAAVKAALIPAVAAAGLLAAASLAAQVALPLTPQLSNQTQSPLAAADSKHPKHKSPQQKPGPQPETVIPVTPLGFAPPAPYYLGDHIAQLSLNFLDEDTLLFTFRVPGLIPREPSPQSSDEDLSHSSRNIRALVLSLPSGRVTAEALWRVHDYGTYLWCLRGHKFLLRDRNNVMMGDSDLHLTPYLRFPGPVKFLELDPDQHLLVANTTEPPAAETHASVPAQNSSSDSSSASGQTSSPNSKSDPGPNSSSDSDHGSNDERNEAPKSASSSNPPKSSPVTSSASLSLSGQFSLDHERAPESQNLLRILRMENRSVMVFSRVPGVVRVPVDGEGYYEADRGFGNKWTIAYNHFNGASTALLQLDSACHPSLEVATSGIVLVSTCIDSGGGKLIALNRNWDENKRRIWEMFIPPLFVWPKATFAADAPRVARATLEVTHPVTSTSPLDSTDIRAQSIEVYDLANGKVELSLAVTPILDGGGNFALSPSGNRFAVLNGGAIQVFALPPVPAISSSAPPAAAPQKSAKKD